MVKFFGLLVILTLVSEKSLAQIPKDKSSVKTAVKASSKKNIVARRLVPPPFFPIPPIDTRFFVPPSIKVSDVEVPISLQKMNISVEVSGLDSETTTTMTFHNPNNRVLEGQLEFPLPADSAVTGYALDIQGQMVDGVIVSKEKARIVLETEIRRGVDPGIVEHVKGNFFRTRVYPIPAKGSRTIKIVTVAPLVLAKDDAALHIPLPQGQAIASLDLEVKINNPDIRPQIGGFGNLTFSNWKDAWTAKTSLKNVTPDNDLYVNLPKLPNHFVQIENLDGEFFVGINDLIPPSKNIETPGPKKISIAWDASMSRKPAAIAKDRAFIKNLLATWKNLQVDFVVFRDQLEAPQIFNITNGGADELLKFIDTVSYDGGTNLSTLNFESTKNTSDHWLLFSDGMATLGYDLPKFGGIPVTVVSSDSARDSGLQRFLVEATGGSLFDLTKLDPKIAATNLIHQSPKLIQVKSAVGALEDVQIRSDAGSDRVSIYAKLKQDTTAELIYGIGKTVTSRTSVVLKKSTARTNNILARSWATAKALELNVFPDHNQQELLQLGQKYNLVTAGTSLIVLERVSQYLEHKIIPPKSMPEWQNEYFASLKQNSQMQRSNESSKIEQVVNMWNERIQWYDRKFSYSKDFKYNSNKKTNILDDASSDGASNRNSIPRPMLPRGSGNAGNNFGSGSGGAGSAQGGNGGEGGMAAPESYDEASAANSAPAEAPMSAAPSAAASDGMAEGVSQKRSLAAGSSANQSASIKISEWSPSTPYIRSYEKAKPADVYNVYLKERSSYKDSPSFYFDSAGYFMKIDRKLAIRILSNLAEMKLEDPALLRMMAWRLSEANELDSAIEILEKVLAIRSEESQSHRDLALALEKRMIRDKNDADGKKALELLNKVIVTDWPHDQPVEVIAVMELNHVLYVMESIKSGSTKGISFIDNRLKKLLDLDIRITMTWDADSTDMDLHVIEPSEEMAFYGNNLTQIGGLVSRDITRGYGPEEYVIRKAMPGKYTIKTNYYGSSQQTLLGPVTVSATVITNYARPNEKRQLLTLRLESQKDSVDVGSILFGAGQSGHQNQDATITRVSKELVKKLKKGMSGSEVISLLGEPNQRLSSGVSIFKYVLIDGTEIKIGFGKGLIYIVEVQEGSEIKWPI
ncbi:MAG: VIT domain-containing protein [Proteobacteria bacterium]|nr:VIT domain-containing protein [Pseudomonadota bacterium]